MTKFSSVLDPLGRPIEKPNGKPRPELAEAFAASKKPRRIEARYDAATDSDEYGRYWANADSYDADSANSRHVREKLVKRSRYEVYNNGYSDGIAQTSATDLIGVGPTLRMQTGSEGFNRLVESEWERWSKAIGFRRKLWCLAHAKHCDGEGMAVIRRTRLAQHPIPLTVRLYETEQFQTPWLQFEDGKIDGIEFSPDTDEPLYYNLLRHHPGTSQFAGYDIRPERIPARFVLHWFKLRRPGQHRGIPESTSTLNLGAAARRFREANLSTAEKIASFTLFLKTIFQPDQLDSVSPMSTLDIMRGMMTALPNNMEPYQLKAEHPAPSYTDFHKTLINEQARPKSMPFNKAACDSSSYNYASGRLDHQTYYSALDVERADCNDLVLDPLFDVWFNLAVARFRWLGGDPTRISFAAKSHLWDWPKHRVADVESEAKANDKQLKNGSKSLTSLYSECGEDYEDAVIMQASANGITPEQQKQINLLLNIPQHVIPAVERMLGLTPEPEPAPQNPDEEEQA